MIEQQSYDTNQNMISVNKETNDQVPTPSSRDATLPRYMETEFSDDFNHLPQSVSFEGRDKTSQLGLLQEQLHALTKRVECLERAFLGSSNTVQEITTPTAEKSDHFCLTRLVPYSSNYSLPGEVFAHKGLTSTSTNPTLVEDCTKVNGIEYPDAVQEFCNTHLEQVRDDATRGIIGHNFESMRHENHREVRRRARKACDNCKQRRVRCSHGVTPAVEFHETSIPIACGQ